VSHAVYLLSSDNNLFRNGRDLQYVKLEYYTYLKKKRKKKRKNFVHFERKEIKDHAGIKSKLTSWCLCN